MRKHFLILMLMALLPFTAWAAEVDISGATVNVVLNNNQLVYTAAKTSPGIVEVTVNEVTYDTEEWSSYFNLVFYKKIAPVSPATEPTYDEIAAEEVRNAGNYAVALKAKTAAEDTEHGITYTANAIGGRTDFTINKATLKVTYTKATKVYGESDPVAIPFTVKSGLVGGDDVNSLVLTFTTLTRDAGDTKENVNATHQYTAIEAETTNYTVATDDPLPVLEITKATLTVTYNLGADIVKVFGDRNPVLDGGLIKIEGWVGAENEGTNQEKADARAAAVTGTLVYEQTATHANKDKEGTNFIGSYTAGFTCEFSGLESTNYDFDYPANKMIIKQRELEATPGVITPGTGYFTYTNKDAEKTFTYDGTVQKPEVEITYTNGDGDVYTLLETDYAVAYDGAGDDDDCKTADTYSATVTPVATGNFATNLAVTAFGYTIKQKDAWVYFKDQSKVYKSADYALNAISADFEFNGVVASDIDTDAKLAAMKVGITASYKDGVATEGAHKNVNSYKILPVIANDAAIKKNYKVTALDNGKLTITKRPIKITATAIERTYDGELPAAGEFAATAEAKDDVNGRGLAGSETIAALEGAYEVALKEDAEKDYTQVGTYTGAVVVNVIDETLAPNYKIEGVPATLKVNGATLNLIAVNKNITYGDVAPKLTYIASGYDGELEIGYTVKQGAKPIDYVEGETILDAGAYTIEINKLDKEAIPVGYETVNYVPGDLNVAKKTLTIVPGDVTVNEGASVANLNTLGKSKVSFIDASENKVTGIDFTLAFNTEGTGSVSVETNTESPNFGNLTSGDGTYNAGYKVLVGETTNDNYTITWGVTGKLIVAEEAQLALDRKADDLLAQLSVANGKTYTVTFTNNIKLEGGKWNCMVLPFNITVAKLSAAMKATGDANGYAIVDLLSTKTTGLDDIRFQLYMGEIPANTPFLVKTATDVKWNEITFPSVEITAPTKEEQVGATATDVEFVGVFKAKKGVADDEIWYLNDQKYIASPNITINAFSAFLRTPEQDAENARIFIEDIDDNGTTVIKELNIKDMTATTVNGWYTLNGVKLNGVPTEKGIYINNGKKIVIK